METKEVGFADKFKSAVILCEAVKMTVVKTVEQYHAAEDQLKTIRALEKQLDEEYKQHPIAVEAKRLQGIKGDLATLLENARKGLKNGPMLAFEEAEEAKRKAEEARLAAIAKAEDDKETARLLDEQRKAFAAAKKRGDAEAAERAQQEARAIKADALAMPAVVVVVEKTAPSVSRRMVPKFRIIDADKLPRQYLMPNEVAIGGVIRSLKQNANIPGIEYYEVPA